MTDQRELDALSERVAKVLGWSVDPPSVGEQSYSFHGKYRQGFGQITYGLNCNMLDWEIWMPCMLAWLNDQKWSVTLGNSADFQRWGAEALDETQSGRGFHKVEAATLPEAVARLVVAVAKREAKP